MAALTAEQRKIYESLKASGKAEEYKTAILNGNYSKANSLASDGGSGTNDKKEDRAVERSMDKEVAADDERAMKKASEFYSEGALGRLTTPEKLARMADPSKIDRVSTQMPGGEQNIAQAQDHYTKAQQRDQYVEQALQSMQAGLGGYNSAENQALRATMSRASRGQTATALRALRGEQAANGVTGNSATAQSLGVLRGAATDRAMQETDILAKNVEEQRLRQANFASAANTADSTMRSDSDAALSRLLGTRKDVADYQQTGELSNQKASGQEVANSIEVNKANADIDKYNIDNAVATDTYNQGQNEKELAGRLGVYTGEMGELSARRASIANRRLGRQQTRVANQGV